MNEDAWSALKRDIVCFFRLLCVYSYLKNDVFTKNHVDWKREQDAILVSWRFSKQMDMIWVIHDTILGRKKR